MTVAHLATEKEFPHFTLYRTKQNGGWEYDFTRLTAFFTSRGYFIYRTSKTKFILIRIIDNIVSEIGKKELKDEIINFLVNIDGCPEYIHQFALKDIAKAVSDDFLETLPAKQVEFRKDRKDAMQLYYQNCIVKITSNGVTTHKYTELNGYIWESQILPRDYEKCEISTTANFCRFISNISNHDQNRVDAVCSALGFYLHNFKSETYCPAIILNDEVISDNPEGGTGKGLLFQAIGTFIKMLQINGKKFTFEKNFLFQRCTSDTKLIFFDDVKKNFDFEQLFSIITEGIEVEKKGKDELYYTFEDSPKIGISTNYALRGTGNSHDRRKFELEISQYYTKKNTPEKEFGHMMFKSNWPRSEWVQFDNYMIRCCQRYLQFGFVDQVLIHLPEKKLIAQTNTKFILFMNDFDFKTTPRADLYNSFISKFDEFLTQKYFSKQLFSKWIEVYAADKGFLVEDYIYNSTRHYKFVKI